MARSSPVSSNGLIDVVGTSKSSAYASAPTNTFPIWQVWQPMTLTAWLMFCVLRSVSFFFFLFDFYFLFLFLFLLCVLMYNVIIIIIIIIIYFTRHIFNTRIRSLPGSCRVVTAGYTAPVPGEIPYPSLLFSVGIGCSNKSLFTTFLRLSLIHISEPTRPY